MPSRTPTTSTAVRALAGLGSVVLVILAETIMISPLVAGDFRETVQEYLAEKAKLRSTPRNKLEDFVKRSIRPKLLEIGKLDTEESFVFLAREFQGGSPEIAAAAVEPLLASSGEKALEVLLRGYSRAQAPVRREILEGLAKAKLELAEAGRQLLELLGLERQPELRALIPPVLGRLDTLNAAQALIGAVGDRRGGESFSAAVIRAVKSSKNPEVKEWLAGSAFRRASPEQLQVLSRLVGELDIKTARSQIIDLLDHPSEEVAIEALDALKKIGMGDATERVADALNRSSRRSITFKIQALDALVASGDPRGLEVVLQAAREGDLETRAIAMGSLARQPRNELALGGVILGLRDSSPQVRAAALRAIGRFRLKGMVGALVDRLENERSEKLQLDTLKVLVEVTGKNMGLASEDWRKWWELAERSFEFPKGEKGVTAVKAYDLDYFGIEVASGQIAFLVDASSSMLQTVAVKRRLDEDDDQKTPGGGGVTRRGPAEGAGEEKEGGGEEKGLKARKIDILKKELVRVISELPAKTQINIIYFHTTFHPWKKKLQSLAGPGRGQAIQFVKELKNSTGTNVYDTLEHALKDDRVDTIFLLTDGAPTRGKYTDPATILRQIEAINRIRGATINCIAFGEESKLLKQLADQNGGVYRFVDRY